MINNQGNFGDFMATPQRNFQSNSHINGINLNQSSMLLKHA